MEILKGDWVTDGTNIARVREVYTDEAIFDLVIYARDGKKLGRVSPAGSGPKNFEPCCSIDGWRKVEKPYFPLKTCYYLSELLIPAKPQPTGAQWKSK